LRWYPSGASSAADVLDGVVALAASACRRPVALLSMVDRTDQWVLARSGMDGLAGVSRSDAICAHTIQGDGIFEVEDLLADRRFAGNPLASSWPRIRSYAGAPIVTADHHAIGALCVIDGEPGRLSEGERHLLRDLAAHTMAVLELLHGRRP
jgi:GAF domain-containing protein